MNNPLNAALGYAARRWPVLPLHGIRHGQCTCRGIAGCKPGKHPVGTLVPDGLKNATTNAKTIIARWTRWPNANIGIRTGGESGLAVIDVDVQHGAGAKPVREGPDPPGESEKQSASWRPAPGRPSERLL